MMYKNKWYKAVLIAAVSVVAVGCTQKYKDVNATAKEAIFGFDDAVKTKEEIQALPYASSSVVIDDGAQLFMVLALAEPSPNKPEQTRLKWLSSDLGMLATENGRLVKTLRLPTDNLANIRETGQATSLAPDPSTPDPLKIKGEKPASHNWQASYDWQPNYRFNYTANVQWTFIESQVIHSDAWDKETNYYQETVTFPAIDAEFTNHFWLDKSTHQVVKSIQQLGPNMPVVQMTILKSFAG
jgi:hypothetical protein